jgi:hypothetical protein
MTPAELKALFPNASQDVIQLSADPAYDIRERDRAERLFEPDPKAAERETGHGGLQERILDFCAAQWPKWKVIRARPDQPSTIAKGCHDLTVFLPGRHTLLVECKANAEKLSPYQLIWKHELGMLDHDVPIVRSLEQFKALAMAEMARPVPTETKNEQS